MTDTVNIYSQTEGGKVITKTDWEAINPETGKGFWSERGYSLASQAGAEPTVGSAYGDITPEQATQNLWGSYGTTPPTMEEEQTSALDLFQTQINAMNKLYADKKAELTAQYGQQAEEELGAQRGLLAASGMAGQYGGASLKKKLKTEQEEKLAGKTGALESELASNIANIRAGATKMAFDIYNQKMEDYRTGQALRSVTEAPKVTAGAISEQVKIALINGIDLSVPEYAQELVDGFAEGGLNVTLKQVQDEYTIQKDTYDKEQAEATAKAEKDAADLEAKQLSNAAARYKLENPEAVIEKPQGGGLYDVTNDRWIIPPKEDTPDEEKPLSPSVILQYQKDYPDSDIKIGDTETTIYNKINYTDLVGQGFSLEEAKDVKDSETPPDWFIQDTNEDQQMTLHPNVMQNIWDAFRRNWLSKKPETKPKQLSDITGDGSSYNSLKDKYSPQE